MIFNATLYFNSANGEIKSPFYSPFQNLENITSNLVWKIIVIK